jgi:hypothetical protein
MIEVLFFETGKRFILKNDQRQNLKAFPARVTCRQITYENENIIIKMLENQAKPD